MESPAASKRPGTTQSPLKSATKKKKKKNLSADIDLPPTHKPPPPHSGRAPAVPLGVHASQVAWLCQTRRAEHRYELPEGQNPPASRPGPPAAKSPPTKQPSRLEWVCHQSGTDRVFINHREHYV